MAQYRMYFIDNSGRFRWPYDLSARGDGDARSVAHAAQYVCADVPVAVELWSGARRVPGTSDRGRADLEGSLGTCVHSSARSAASVDRGAAQ